METIEIFRNHGVELSNPSAYNELAEKLGELPNDELFNILEDFTGDETIGIKGDETLQSLTLSRALVEAFTKGKDSITQADIDAAQERAQKVAEGLSGKTAESDKIESEAVTETPKPKRKRTGKLKPAIKKCVEDNPDAQSDEVVTMMTEQDSEVNPVTARMYYYQVRKELGLPTIGKRGRKPADTFDNLKSMLKDNLDKPKSDMVEKFVKEFGVTEGTASSYYSKAKTELTAEV